MVLGIGKKKGLGQTEKLAFAHGITVSDSGKTQTDIEVQRELGINRLLITDDDMNDLVKGMAFNVVKVIGSDGKLVEQTTIVPRWAAVFIIRSQLIRTSYNSKHDAYIGMLETEDLLDKVAMQMSELEYENGGSLLLQAIQLLAETAWSDSIEGRKAKLLKVSPKTYEIGFRGQDKKSGSRGYM